MQRSGVTSELCDSICDTYRSDLPKVCKRQFSKVLLDCTCVESGQGRRYLRLECAVQKSSNALPFHSETNDVRDMRASHSPASQIATHRTSIISAPINLRKVSNLWHLWRLLRRSGLRNTEGCKGGLVSKERGRSIGVV